MIYDVFYYRQDGRRLAEMDTANEAALETIANNSYRIEHHEYAVAVPKQDAERRQFGCRYLSGYGTEWTDYMLDPPSWWPANRS